MKYKATDTQGRTVEFEWMRETPPTQEDVDRVFISAGLKEHTPQPDTGGSAIKEYARTGMVPSEDWGSIQQGEDSIGAKLKRFVSNKFPEGIDTGAGVVAKEAAKGVARGVLRQQTTLSKLGQIAAENNALVEAPDWTQILPESMRKRLPESAIPKNRPDLAEKMAKPFKWWEQATDTTIEQLGLNPTPQNMVEQIAGQGGEGLTSILISRGIAATTGSGLLSGAWFGATSGANKYFQMKEAGVEKPERGRIALADAVLEGGIEMLNLELFLHPKIIKFLPPFLVRSAGEGVEELLQETKSNLLEKYGWNENKKLSEGVLPAGIMGFVLAGMTSGAFGDFDFDTYVKDMSQQLGISPQDFKALIKDIEQDRQVADIIQNKRKSVFDKISIGLSIKNNAGDLITPPADVAAIADSNVPLNTHKVNPDRQTISHHLWNKKTETVVGQAEEKYNDPIELKTKLQQSGYDDEQIARIIDSGGKLKLIHFSDVPNMNVVDPSHMGEGQGGQEMRTQFEDNKLRPGFARKSNYYIADSNEIFEGHRWIGRQVYTGEVAKALVYDADLQNNLPSDRTLKQHGFVGYKLDGQVRLFEPLEVENLGKFEFMDGAKKASTLKIKDAPKYIFADTQGVGLSTAFPVGRIDAENDALPPPKRNVHVDNWNDLKTLQDPKNSPLLNTTFSIITGYLKTNTAEENRVAMAAIEKDLRDAGYPVIYKSQGKYGTPEPSFIVPSMTEQEAMDLATKYKQESVIVPGKMLYTGMVGNNPRGSYNPETGLRWLVNEKDNYTIFNPTGKQDIQFTFDYDWNNLVAAGQENVAAPRNNPDIMNRISEMGDLDSILTVDKKTIVYDKAGKPMKLNPEEEYRAYDILDNEGKHKILLQDGEQVIINPSQLKKLKEKGEVISRHIPPSEIQAVLSKVKVPASQVKSGITQMTGITKPTTPTVSERQALQAVMYKAQKSAREAAIWMKRRQRDIQLMIKRIGAADIENLSFEERKEIQDLQKALKTTRSFDGIVELYNKVMELKAIGKEKYEEEMAKREALFEAEKQALVTAAKVGREIPEESGRIIEGKKQFGFFNIPKILRMGSVRFPRLLDMVDGGKNFKGVWHDFFYVRPNKAVNEELEGIDRRVTGVLTKMSELGIKPSELSKFRIVDGTKLQVQQMMGIYGFWQNEQSAMALIFGNHLSPQFINSVIDNLTVSEKQLMDAMMDDMDDNFQRVRFAHILYTNGKHDLMQVHKYFPMRRTEVNYTPNEAGEIPLVSELGTEFDSRSQFRDQYANHEFAKPRLEISAENQTPIRLDAFTLFLEQVSKQEHYVAAGSVVKDMQRMLHSKEIRPLVNHIVGEAGASQFQHAVNRIANPSIYKAHDGLDRTVVLLRNNAVLASLSFNLITSMVQFPSYIAYLEEASLQHWLSAVWEYGFGHEKIDETIHRLSPQLKHRSLERDFEELKQTSPNQYSEVVRKLGQRGMAMIVAIDKLATHAGFWAVYQTQKDKDMSDEEAAKIAEEVTLRTQPAAHPKDLAGIYAHPGRAGEFLHLFTQFTNQLNQYWNMLTWDIPSDVKHKRYDYATRRLLALMMIFAFVSSIRRGFRRPKAEDILDTVISMVPVIGNFMVWSRRGSYGSPIPIGMGLESVARTVRDVQKGEYDKALKDASRSIAYTYGIPYSQAGRTIRGINDLLDGKTTSLRRLIWSESALKEENQENDESSMLAPSEFERNEGGVTFSPPEFTFETPEFVR